MNRKSADGKTSRVAMNMTSANTNSPVQNPASSQQNNHHNNHAQDRIKSMTAVSSRLQNPGDLDGPANPLASDELQTIEWLEHAAKQIALLDDKWIDEWAAIGDKFFRKETRKPVRLKALAILSQIFSKYHVVCEDELMNRVLLPILTDVDQETESVVRKPIVHLLFDVANACYSYKNCNAILAIVRRIISKPYKQHTKHDDGGDQDGPIYVIGNVDVIDSRLTITNLIKLFKAKLYRVPIDPAFNILDILVNYLNLTYQYPLQEPLPAEIPMIRRELLMILFSLRCNSLGHLGIILDNQSYQVSSSSNHHASTSGSIIHSPFLICVKRARYNVASTEQISIANHETTSHNNNKQPESPTQTSFPSSSLANNTSSSSAYYGGTSGGVGGGCSGRSQSNHQHIICVPSSMKPSNLPINSRCIDIDPMFVGLISCISKETDVEVLRLALAGLPGLLANTHIVHKAADERINQLCLALCELVRGPRLAKQTCRADIVQCALKCLTALLPYRKLLDTKSIKQMLSSLDDSLKVLSSRHPIVPLFTTCLLELRDSSELAKFLPVILNRLSKFSPTPAQGINMLELLSYLILFPRLYENFSEDEYKFIFAIALPYTNPFRFNNYITCLAFRVIAMWYLNCRPPLRSAFVQFVKRSLQSNVLQPFKDNSQPLYHNQQYNRVMCSAHNNIISPSSGQQASHFSPLIHTPPITHSCPPTMSPMDQRKRSLSLNTENSFRAQQAAYGIPNQQASLQVNEELIETFADLLSFYKHGSCLGIAPKRRWIDSIVDRSTSQTWLYGNSLISITCGSLSGGWTEIVVRRPTGNTSWFGKLQNAHSAMCGATNTFDQQAAQFDSMNFGYDIVSLISTMTLQSDCADDETNNGGGGQPSGPLAAQHQPAERGMSVSSFSSMMSSSAVSVASTATAGGSTQTISSSMHDNGDASSRCTLAKSIVSQLREPILLPRDKMYDIALNNFDLITPYETHKIGVVYVGHKQSHDRTAILSNQRGSASYHDFLSSIGSCVLLSQIDPEVCFTGGLDIKGDDGAWAFFWSDSVMQVIFHVATLMPTREHDKQCNNKNRHIGNDHVCIVYNESDQPFKLATIKGSGQIMQACIVVTPLDSKTNRVEVEVLPELRETVGDIEPKTLSTLGSALYARCVAIHLGLASKICERKTRDVSYSKELYVSNWVERLRSIKRIRQRLENSKRT